MQPVLFVMTYYPIQDVVNAGASIRPLIYEQLLHADLRDTVRKSCFDRVNFLDAGDITGNFLVQVCMYEWILVVSFCYLNNAVYVDHFSDWCKLF